MQLPAQLHVKLSSSDLNHLKALARRSGYTLSQTIRALIRTAKTVPMVAGRKKA